MDLSNVRAFVATVDAGSFAAAARATRVPKSTLANRVGDLETLLGVRLLERTTRRQRLTPDGELFLKRARRLVEDAQDLERLMKDRDATPRGLLRVAVPTLFGMAFMGALAARFAAIAPEAAIDVVFADRRVDLIEENIDCAIRVGPLEDASLIARSIALSHSVVVAAPAQRDQHGAPAHPDMLREWPQVAAAPAETPQLWALERGPERWTMRPDGRVQLGGMIAAREAVIAGAGVAWLPEFIVAEAVAGGRLVRLLPGWRSAATPISLLYPSRRHVSARVRTFSQVMTEAFPNRRLPGALDRH